MKQLFITITSTFLIFLWVYTAFSKLVDLTHNAAILQRAPFLHTLAPGLAVIVPALELLTAALLLFNTSRQRGLWLSLVLLSVFTAYILTALAFASWLPCTCGGIIQSMSWVQHLLFNLFFILITAFSIKFKMVKKLQSGSCRKPVTE